MKRAAGARLSDAYALLRRVEHRIQYLDDQQTHVLPTDDGDLDWIARSLGHGGEDGTAQFLDLLCTARECVAVEFDQLLHDGRAPAQNGCRTCGPTPLPVDSEDFLAQLPAELAARIRPLCAQSKIKLLRDDSKVRLGRLVSRAVRAVGKGAARRRPRSSSSTGSSRCCAAKATWPCSPSGPKFRTGCCACSAWRAGRCAT
jgi:glutamate-ammonia-ligase adenylyltransferase